jgi:hypothetical protein
VVVKEKRIDRENELSEIRGKSAGLSTRDAQAIRDAVPGVERVVAKIEVEAWKVLSPAGRAKPRVLGVSSDYPELVRLSLREGRFFDRADEDTRAAVRDRGQESAAVISTLLDRLCGGAADYILEQSRRTHACSTS